jgi:chorismate--pyruvate lyase
VRVLAQAVMPLWREEEQDLGVRSGYVREVVLLLDGVPVVWARSATPLHAMQGPWRAMRGLGTRPLAELLFAGRRVQRLPLQAHRLASRGRMERHVRKQWLGLPQQAMGAKVPQWARSSVFLHKGQPLRVMEAFAPWVSRLGVSRLHIPDTRIADR